MTLYCIYDMKYSEQCVVVSENLKDIANFLERGTRSISTAICKGSSVKHRYKVIRLEVDDG